MKFEEYLAQEQKRINQRLAHIKCELSLGEPKPVIGMSGFSVVTTTITTPTQTVSGEIYFDLVKGEQLLPKYKRRITQSLQDMERMLRDAPIAPPEAQELANMTGLPVAYVHGEAGANTIMVWPQKPKTDD